jgi:hypothetical protein
MWVDVIHYIMGIENSMEKVFSIEDVVLEEGELIQIKGGSQDKTEDEEASDKGNCGCNGKCGIICC